MGQWWAGRATWGARTWLITIGGLLLTVSALLALAYQLPVRATIHTDGLGDQPFVGTTEMQRQEATDAGLLYPDEMDAVGRRYRWTRGRVLLDLPGLGGGRAYDLTITAAGWPADILRSDLDQPYVHVLANGRPLAVWAPMPEPAEYRFDLPAPESSDLRLELLLSSSPTQAPPLTATATFTATAQYPDDRAPKGLRLYGVALSSRPVSLGTPNPSVLGRTLLAVLLVLAASGPQRRHPGRWIGTALLLALGMSGLVALNRLWALPALSLLLPAALALALWRWRGPIGRWLMRWRSRALASRALESGLLLTTAAGLLVALGPGLIRLMSELAASARTLDPSAIITFSLLGTLLLMLALRWPAINRAFDRFDRRLRTRPRLGWLALAMITGIWLAYGWSVIRGMGYVGNADYSDNAVVARNLASGRGWVVDYVTQFYRLYPGGSVTRVQETWPLAQPVWIAPFFAMFGVSDWAAKIPNLIFFALLAVIIYSIAARVWDRRVGLAAVLLLLINRHMFRLLIYSTADLGFVVFYAAALILLWRAVAGPRSERDRPLLLGSGLLVGLMCWQKTSAVVVAAGMGLWVLWRIWRSPRRDWPADLRRIALWWVLPAALVFAPFIARNLIEFGKPVYSTESYDAWVLEYQGTSSTDFESIYRVFTDDGGLTGTGGLPDPSWIKRWGYQRTLGKISNQLRSVRDSLLPPSAALGPLSGKGNLMGNLDLGSANPRAWLTAGSMLALLGLLTLRRRQASLLNLVLWSYAPYTLFLATYWHANEERYFVPLIPFLALLAGAAIWGIHDALARAGGGRWRPLGLLAAGCLLVLALQPGWVEAADKSAPTGVQADWNADLEAFAWLKANTPPDAVVMTRVPWQLNFHAERPAVMVPNERDLTTTLRIARYYRARYLLVNAITNNKEGAAVALGDLLRGQEAANFKQVAAFAGPKNRTIYIYEFPANYNDVAPLSLSGAGNGQQ